MAILLRKKIKRSTKKWFLAIDEFSQFLRDFLGDKLVEVIASEYPELGFNGYNFVIVVHGNISDEEKNQIISKSEEICWKLKADFSIIPIIVDVNTPEYDEFRAVFFRKYDPKWDSAISKFSQFLRDFLGDKLVEVIASEYPELGFNGYNVIIVTKTELNETEKERILEASEKICEELKAEFSIMVLFEVKE